MKKTWIVFLGIVVIAGCSSDAQKPSSNANVANNSIMRDNSLPSEDQAKSHFNECFEAGLSVINFRKTNGENREILGRTYYWLYFEAKIKNKSDIIIPNSDNLTDAMKGMDIEKMKNMDNFRKLFGVGLHKAGSFQTIKGAVVFVKKENGWEFKSVEGLE